MSLVSNCGTGINPDRLPKPQLPEDKVRPVKIDCLDRYDRRVKTEMGKLTPTNATEELVMSCFDLYRRKHKVTDPSQTGVDDRYDSFIHALNNSYNAERIKIVEKTQIEPHYDEEYLSIITPDEKKGIKNVMIPFYILPEVGKLVYWVREQSYWMITSREETEKAYFKGTIEKCNYVLSWKDENGNRYKQRVRIQGPVETKFKNEILGDFIGGKANETNSVWITKTDYTKHLRKYKQLIINGKGYEITVINDVDSIIKMNLIESFINPEQDSIIAGEELDDGLLDDNYEIKTSIDEDLEMPLTGFDINTLLFREGILIPGANPQIIIVSGKATVIGNKVYPEEVGELVIKICYPNHPISRTLVVTVVEVDDGHSYYDLVGSSTINMYSSEIYQSIKMTNGSMEVLSPSSIALAPDSEKLATLETDENNKLVKITPKKLGTIKIVMTIDSDVIEKTIKIVNPW